MLLRLVQAKAVAKVLERRAVHQLVIPSRFMARAPILARGMGRLAIMAMSRIGEAAL